MADCNKIFVDTTTAGNFHHAADGIIWKTWSYHYKVKVNGNSDFAKKHKNTVFTINFDIQWVLNAEHWKVKVTKNLPGKFLKSNVESWTNRIINLDTEDIVSQHKGKGYYQLPVAHEFGHTIGNNPWWLKGMHSDEYHDKRIYNGGFKSDYASIMNLGNELRNRHIDYI